MLEQAYTIAENLNPNNPDFGSEVKKLSKTLAAIKGTPAMGLSIIKNRVASVDAALTSKSITRASAYKSLAGVAGDIEPLLTKKRKKTVEAAAKPSIIMRELSDLSKVKDLFNNADKTLKSFGVDFDDDLQRKSDTEWLDHTRTENDYDAGLSNDAEKQGGLIESFSKLIPKYSNLKAKINKTGWTWVMSPLLVVFGLAPKRDAIKRSRLEFQNLTMGHHATERLRGETGKLGTIINQQMLLVFPSSLIKTPKEFQEEVDAAKSTLEMRLGKLDIITTVKGTKQVGRLTETHKVDFTPLTPPTPPVEPNPPPRLKRNATKEQIRENVKQKDEYKKKMEAFKKALPEYNKKYQEYEKAIEDREKAIADVKKKEANKLKFDSNSYFRSPLYPKLVFVWVMRKSVLNTLMPMRVKDIAFPSLRTDAEIKREEKISGSVEDAVRVRNHVFDMIKNTESTLNQAASQIQALTTSYQNTVNLLKKQNPKSTMYRSLQSTLAALKVNIEQRQAELEKAKRSLPKLMEAARSLQATTNKLVRDNK